MELLIGILVYVIAAVLLEAKAPELGTGLIAFVALLICGIAMFLAIIVRER